jgi:hypothetical protein
MNERYVYIVTKWDNEWCETIGVFDTLEQALTVDSLIDGECTRHTVGVADSGKIAAVWNEYNGWERKP